MLMGKEGVRHDDTRQPRWGTHASQLAKGRASSMGARGMCEPFGEPITPLTPAATNTAATRLDAPQRACGTGQILIVAGPDPERGPNQSLCLGDEKGFLLLPPSTRRLHAMAMALLE